jgi:hypothetical protein
MKNSATRLNILEPCKVQKDMLKRVLDRVHYKVFNVYSLVPW